MTLQSTAKLAALGLLLLSMAGCGGENAAQAAQANDAAPAAAPAPAATAFTEDATPDAGGKVIDVKMTTESDGTNAFEPEALTAKQGDVIRFTLGTGVHNIHFIEASTGTELPAPSDFLQVPGQVKTFKVTLPAGEYKFQCDPHAALGMTGSLTVE
jgi:plastocyanin